MIAIQDLVSGSGSSPVTSLEPSSVSLSDKTRAGNQQRNRGSLLAPRPGLNGHACER